ncbi:hypothetical protein BB561_003952 [Smittium simulii]|uniref:Jacalin-type lectin domain-containing protein n=1 Tax=Smittium simulii TaxID=133385 RepID=A0A2T9YIU5_9FUNG|nr:hypothetical protein BB561_003952 [Smittium simulii]
MSNVTKLKSYLSNLANKAGISTSETKKQAQSTTPSDLYPGNSSRPQHTPASASPYAANTPSQTSPSFPNDYQPHSSSQYPSYPPQPQTGMLPEFANLHNLYPPHAPMPPNPYQQPFEQPYNSYNPYNSNQQPSEHNQNTQSPAISLPVLQKPSDHSNSATSEIDKPLNHQDNSKLDSAVPATNQASFSELSQHPKQQTNPSNGPNVSTLEHNNNFNQPADTPNIPLTSMGEQHTFNQPADSSNIPAISLEQNLKNLNIQKQINDNSQDFAASTSENNFKDFSSDNNQQANLNQNIDLAQLNHQADSQSAPQYINFTNIVSGQLVHHRFLIVHGKLETGTQENGVIMVIHPYFPFMEYEIKSNYFKAIVELENGDNNIVFKYRSNKGLNIEQKLLIKMMPNLDKPPLQIAIVLGKDSTGMYDIDPEKIMPPKNWLNDAISRLRCAVYLWQAFTAEQMRRNGYGFRTFRLEEEYSPDTMTNRDKFSRMNLKVHVLRSELTVSQIQDKERAQQWNPPPGYERKIDDSQFDVASRAIDAYGGPLLGDRRYIAALSIDSHWSPDLKVALGHAALGGGSDSRKLGVFGSHLMYGWPSCIEEVVPFFNDTTQINTKFISDDGNSGLGYWRSANVGMGAFLHEVGHLLTMPHSPSGIMSRGFDNFNRTFCVSEPKNQGPIKPEDELGSHWHKTDIIRLRYHPLFTLPGEKQPSIISAKPVFYLINNGLLVQSKDGISMIECYVNDYVVRHAEFTLENLSQRKDGRIVTFTPEERSMENPTSIIIDLGYWKKLTSYKESDNIKFEVTTKQQGLSQIDNVYDFIRKNTITMPNGLLQYATAIQGRIPDSDETHDAFFLPDSESFLNIPNGSKLSSLSKIRNINAHFNLNDYTISAIEFVTANGKSTFIGNTGSRGSRVVRFNIPEDDGLQSIAIRSGYWVDGFEFKTRKGLSSGMIGGNGGSLATITAPPGHIITGMRAYAGEWIDGLVVFYARIE